MVVFHYAQNKGPAHPPVGRRTGPHIPLQKLCLVHNHSAGVVDGASHNADEIHAALINDLDTFLGIETYDDDMTMVVIKWNGINLPASTNKKKQTALRPTNIGEPG